MFGSLQSVWCRHLASMHVLLRNGAWVTVVGLALALLSSAKAMCLRVEKLHKHYLNHTLSILCRKIIPRKPSGYSDLHPQSKSSIRGFPVTNPQDPGLRLRGGVRIGFGH